jgi:hypothetical protein
MQGAFIATCLLGSWVFWRRRRIDPVLLGFVSCLFYFAPALPGRIDVRQNFFVCGAAVAPETYGVLIIVLLVGSQWSRSLPPATRSGLAF